MRVMLILKLVETQKQKKKRIKRENLKICLKLLFKFNLFFGILSVTSDQIAEASPENQKLPILIFFLKT